MRTKKMLLNVITDILPYIIIGVIGLVKMNVLIKYVGDVGNGYYQTINQIISYVFLAQFGFDDAVIYSLYKPFAEKNKDDINRIYSGSRYIFKIIGVIIIAIVAIVSLGLYLFYGFNDGYRNSSLICFIVICCSYLIAYFGKTQTYRSILCSNQEKYIYSSVINTFKIICDLLIIFASIKFRNLESIAIVILIVKILEEITMRIVVKKRYYWLKEVENKNTTMVKMVKDLGVSQIGYLILNNVDAILLMGFLGPTIVSIYTTYNYILRFLSEIASRIQVVSVYSFGNVLASDEKEEKVIGLYNESFTLFSIISFSLSLTFLLGIRTFVNLWINDPTYILSYRTAVLFTATLFLGIIYYPLLTLINANGQFKTNKNHTLTCAIINLILSFVLIKPYGIDGLLFATSLAYFVNIILKAKDTGKTNLKKLGVHKVVTTYMITVIIFFIVCYLFKYIEILFFNNIHSILTCILGLGITFIVLIFLITAIMYMITPATKELLNRGKNLIKRKSS